MVRLTGTFWVYLTYWMRFKQQFCLLRAVHPHLISLPDVLLNPKQCTYDDKYLSPCIVPLPDWLYSSLLWVWSQFLEAKVIFFNHSGEQLCILARAQASPYLTCRDCLQILTRMCFGGQLLCIWLDTLSLFRRTFSCSVLTDKRKSFLCQVRCICWTCSCFWELLRLCFIHILCLLVSACCCSQTCLDTWYFQKVFLLHQTGC